MTSYRLDELKTVEQNIDLLLSDDENILHRFEVVPLDYNIIDRKSPTLLLTEYRLLFLFDEIIEVYNLEELEIGLLGDAPKFRILQLLFEGSYTYIEGNELAIQQMKSSESIVRMTVNEQGQVPKEFILRNGYIVGKNYQTWAMTQIIINTKNRNQGDGYLENMLTGALNILNTRGPLNFIPILILYIIIRFIIVYTGIGIIGVVIDFLFILITGYLGYTIYRNMDKNLKKYSSVYRYYQTSTEQLSEQPISEKKVTN